MCRISICQLFDRHSQTLWQRSAAVYLALPGTNLDELPWPLACNLNEIPEHELGIGEGQRWRHTIIEFDCCMAWHGEMSLESLELYAEQHDPPLWIYLRDLPLPRAPISAISKPCWRQAYTLDS